jgi:tRNA pseudouridine38-40 synthase
VSFDAEPGLDEWRLQRSVTALLEPEVVVRSCELVEPGFDARHSARWREYRYTVVNRPVPDPFRDRFSWWVPDPLDLRALRLAADPFVGEHDFASFCRKGAEGSTTVRRVLSSRWVDEGEGVLRYEIRATAFCWQMVRAIVGTLVDVGVGRRRPGEMMATLRALDRSVVGNLAPPAGLCLWQVGYDEGPGARTAPR